MDNMLFGDLKKAYFWEIETIDGIIYTQFDNEGNERKRDIVFPEDVVRFSLIPNRLFLPKHDCLFDSTNQYIESKARGFMKASSSGYILSEYVHCVTALSYRTWIFSSTGKVVCTKKDYELYI